jgi:hypothetical protein
MEMNVERSLVHPLHPSLILPPQLHEHRIYADDYEHLFVVVDAADYQFFSQWRWEPKFDKRGKKLYLMRRAFFSRHSARRLWLHKEILERHRGPPPHPTYTIGDHRDGNSENCRLANLRWATPSMNRRNINGVAALASDLVEHDAAGEVRP